MLNPQTNGNLQEASNDEKDGISSATGKREAAGTAVPP